MMPFRLRMQSREGNVVKNVDVQADQDDGELVMSHASSVSFHGTSKKYGFVQDFCHRLLLISFGWGL